MYLSFTQLQNDDTRSKKIEENQRSIDNSHYRLILKLGKEMQTNHFISEVLKNEMIKIIEVRCTLKAGSTFFECSLAITFFF